VHVHHRVVFQSGEERKGCQSEEMVWKRATTCEGINLLEARCLPSDFQLNILFRENLSLSTVSRTESIRTAC